MQGEIEKFITGSHGLSIVFEELKDPEDSWAYYIVDHNKQSIFWLSSYDAGWIANQIYGLPELPYTSMRY